MKKNLYISLFILLPIIFVTFVFKISSVPTITYFPIDKNEVFLQANTSLDLDENLKSITWTSYSESENNLYLRQDISLTYANGQFKGVLSKWKEDASVIELDGSILAEKEHLLQTISYHYGEIHRQNKINSNHYMSFDHLYVVESPYSTLTAFKNTNVSSNLAWKELLDDATNQRLQSHWDEWINYYEINKNNYIHVPLVELHQFNENTLPSLDQKQTDKIIGQLWEGLYKNYIIPITSGSKKDVPEHFMPLILFDKQNTHLLVLFKLSGKNEILLQKYSFD